MHSPQDIAANIETRPRLPGGDMERFIGYGVMAQPFASGHILALRRFPATSIGPAYSAVWHRDPGGRWTFRITGDPLQCCNRYFGSEVIETVQCDIALAWRSPHELTITTGDAGVHWTITLASTPITMALNASGAMMPNALWRQAPVTSMMGTMAGGMLRCGHMAMRGTVPNGQRFLANPPAIWLATGSTATVGGDDLGSPGPLRVQDRLEDFWLPQRGLFFVGSILFEPYDASRHHMMADRSMAQA